MTKRDNLKVAFLGNYVPRKCGIATFTFDLENAVNSVMRKKDSTFVVAMNNIPEGYDYPDRVRQTVYQPAQNEYLKAADMINASDADVVSIQHEFGIFGGECGSYLLDFMHHLKKPSVVTLHTVFKEPPEPYRTVTKDIADHANNLVVMSERAVGYLEDSYGISARKIRMIHHGVPEFSYSDSSTYKSKFGFQGRTILGTFGLISRNKGIEHVIKQLPSVVEKHPDLLYVILGETHPEVKRHEGERYRESLLQMADDLGVSDNVRFIARFLEITDLVTFLQATDIYITPYQGKEQITSGTLAYSLAAGKPVISTPYWYAQELLDEGRGILVDFGESDGIGKALLDLLDNPAKRDEIRQKAFKFGRRMTWPIVAHHYVECFKEAEHERIVFIAPVAYSEIRKSVPISTSSRGTVKNIKQDFMSNGTLPRVNMNHIRVLTDDTGIIQHAMYSVPDRKTGYCIDDNSRALITAIRAQEFFREKTNINLAKTYLSFIHYAQISDGRFHNFMNYERKFIDEVGSEDSYGRTIWALGYLIQQAPTLGDAGMDSLAREIFDRAYPNAKRIISPRAWAYCILGYYNYLTRYPKNETIREMMREFADRLVSLYKAFKSDEWKWFEPIISYDNGKLPQALYHAGEILRNREYYKIAEESLDFLTVHLFKDDIFSPIGTKGWLKKGNNKAEFDQQPIEGPSMIDAYLVASQSQSTHPVKAGKYDQLAILAWEWFTGKNAIKAPLYDPKTGSCADGLGDHEISLNEGAESTISAVLALQSIRENLKAKTMGKAAPKVDVQAKVGEKPGVAPVEIG